MPHIVNHGEFARILGKSRTAVDNYVAQGMPGHTPAPRRGQEAQIDLHQAIPWLLTYVRDELDRARTRLADEQTARTKLQVATLNGALVPAERVLQVWTRLLVNFKTRILAMPSKLAGVLAGEDEPNVIRDKIEAEALQALAELSDEGAFRSARSRAPNGVNGSQAAAEADDQPMG